MNIENETYRKDLKNALLENLPWNKLNEKTILITGASGLIGSCIVDMLMLRNSEFSDSNINIIALGRNEQEAKKRFARYIDNKNFSIVRQDITEEFNIEENADFIIHAASNAHPKAFITDPVNTILGNIVGVNNLFKYAIKKKTKKLLFVSSGEIYGQGTQEIESFDEEYRGYINNMQLRAGYPISKQAAENLCIAYAEQYDIQSVIVRPCHIYGPTITPNDSRAFAQFLRNGIANEDILMKSKGEQMRSYCYVVDCAVGMIYALLEGKNKEAYNIANPNSAITIHDLAQLIAKECSAKVIVDTPEETEKKGYNPVNRSVLDSTKLQTIGWAPRFDIKRGISHTVKILREA